VITVSKNNSNYNTLNYEFFFMNLDYLIRPSNLKENAPVIIMLHGYGSDEKDLFSFAPELPEKYFIISLRAPYAMPGFGNAWYEINFDADQNKFSNIPQAVESREKVTNFLDEVVKKYPIDPDQITLLGFSQGTILSYAVALSYPEKVKQVIALSGYIDENMIAGNFREKDFSKLRFYCSHGSVDQVIPVEWARRNKPFLDALNIKNTYSEFPVGHGVAPENFFEFRDWLERG